MKSLKVIRRFILKNIAFQKEEQEEETFSEILDGTYFKGYNLWILGCAMIIACIGLSTNNSGALVGAMLISPLMGPIVGYAFSLAVNNRELKIKSIRNWVWMTVVSLFASVLFFLVTPFDRDTQALHSFENATIFDIFLAFFGGVAGFIGIVKKDGAKIIAGVAIATACMPPLCTVGYGLSQLNLSLFLGGLYFYLINCMFIGLGTFLMSKFAGYKALSSVNSLLNKFVWAFLITTMVLPGTYIAYKKWHEEKRKINEPSLEQKVLLLEKKVAKLDSILNKNNKTSK